MFVVCVFLCFFLPSGASKVTWVHPWDRILGWLSGRWWPCIPAMHSRWHQTIMKNCIQAQTPGGYSASPSLGFTYSASPSLGFTYSASPSLGFTYSASPSCLTNWASPIDSAQTKFPPECLLSFFLFFLASGFECWCLSSYAINLPNFKSKYMSYPWPGPACSGLSWTFITLVWLIIMFINLWKFTFFFKWGESPALEIKLQTAQIAGESSKI